MYFAPIPILRPSPPFFLFSPRFVSRQFGIAIFPNVITISIPILVRETRYLLDAPRYFFFFLFFFRATDQRPISRDDSFPMRFRIVEIGVAWRRIRAMRGSIPTPRRSNLNRCTLLNNLRIIMIMVIMAISRYSDYTR